MNGAARRLARRPRSLVALARVPRLLRGAARAVDLRRACALLAGTVCCSDVLGEGFEIPPDRFDRPADFATPARRLRGRAAGAGALRRRRRRGRRRSRWPRSTRPPRRGRSRTPTPTTWCLGAGGTLADAAAPTRGAADRYRYDPDAFPRVLADDRARAAATRRSRRRRTTGSRCPTGKALTLHERPARRRHRHGRARAASTSGCGPARPTSTSRSPISEVRPDGQETYVQSGWLRAGAARARRRGVDRPASRSRRSRARRRRAAAEGRVHASCGCRSTRSATCSARARACASWCSRRAATARRGRSTRSPTTGRSEPGRPRAARTPSKVVLPVVEGIDVPTPAARVWQPAGPTVPTYAAER